MAAEALEITSPRQQCIGQKGERRAQDARISLDQSKLIPWDSVDGFGSKEEGHSGCGVGNQHCCHVLDAANFSMSLESEGMTNEFW